MANRDVQIFVNGNPLKGAINGNENGILDACIALTGQAKVLAPVDKGQLRNSISYKTTKGDGGLNDSSGETVGQSIDNKPTKEVGYVGTALDHAIYQEFGTSRTPAQPFLRTAGAQLAGNTKLVKELIAEQNKAMALATRGRRRVR